MPSVAFRTSRSNATCGWKIPKLVAMPSVAFRTSRQVADPAERDVHVPVAMPSVAFRTSRTKHFRVWHGDSVGRNAFGGLSDFEGRTTACMSGLGTGRRNAFGGLSDFEEIPRRFR